MGRVVDPAVVDYLMQAGSQAGRHADRLAESRQVGRQVQDR
jgi:hypothetical protein